MSYNVSDSKNRNIKLANVLDIFFTILFVWAQYRIKFEIEVIPLDMNNSSFRMYTHKTDVVWINHLPSNAHNDNLIKSSI